MSFLNFSRRNFVKTIGGLGTGVLLGYKGAAEGLHPRSAEASYMGDFQAPKMEAVRCAFIGVGARGSGHARQIAQIEGTEVVAIADIYEYLAKRSADICYQQGGGQRHKDISLYHGSEDAWKKMLKEVKPDAVFISTPWKLHAPMAIQAMESGSHAFVEVPIALTIEEMWKIVDTSETTKKHCMMMENVNYGRDELMFLNMCRKGAIGELLHSEAAYIHELRGQMNEVERGQARGERNIMPIEMAISIPLTA